MSEAGLTTLIVIGGTSYDKPYDPGCAACVSPMTLQIDSFLSYGWGIGRIRDYLGALKVDVPSADVLRGHIRHLAPPHYKARTEYEADVAARGGNSDDPPSLDALDLARITLQRVYERVVSGDADVSVRDAVAMLKIKREIERDQAQEGTLATAEAWQAAMMQVLWIARKHLGKMWPDFARDVRSDETIAAVTGGLMAEDAERKEIPSGAAAAASAPAD